MTKRLFVGNLSFDVSEAQLQEAFAAYGSSAATIPTNDNGRPKGFGFVDVQADQMESAISGMNGKELGDRAIAVSEAKPKPEVNAWGGSGGRGGYGGRGGFGGGRGGFGGNRGGGGGGYGGGGGNRW